MSGKTLRALAKDHASGVLDKDAYRKARDLLFDGVLNGKILVEPIDFRPPLDIQDLDVTMERERTEIRSVPPQKQSANPTTGPVSIPESTAEPKTSHVVHATKIEPAVSISLILGITIVIIIGLVILLALPHIYEVTGTVNTDSNAVSESELSGTEYQQTGHTTAGTQLISDFLAQNDWSDNNMEEFKAAWNSLTAEEQADGLNSPLKGQLTNAIYQQLLEERALLGLSDTETVLSRQHSLVNFAADLGINDQRLQVQEQQ